MSDLKSLKKSKDKKTNKLNIAIAKYQVANERNILESQTQWSRTSSFLTFNSILIAALVLTYQNNVSIPSSLQLFFPVIGLFSCYLWFVMNARSFKWIKHWIDSARKIEKEYLKDKYRYSLNPITKGNRIKNRDKICLNSEYSTNLLIAVIILIYLFILHFSINSLYFNEWKQSFCLQNNATLLKVLKCSYVN